MILFLYSIKEWHKMDVILVISAVLVIFPKEVLTHMSISILAFTIINFEFFCTDIQHWN